LQNKVRILAIGDVVGKGGRKAILKAIPMLKSKYQYDYIIVNVENTTHGNGLSYKHYLSYKEAGVDVMTMGNHTFGKKEIDDYIDKANNLLVPANLLGIDSKYDANRIYSINHNGYSIKVINIIGDYGMDKLNKESYVTFFDKIYNQDTKSIYIIDFHAEITAEKNVFGYMADGKASFVYGTHTHVQTADERILPQGAAFISDVGMCGSVDSVIGYDYKMYVSKVYGLSSLVEASTITPLMINGAVVDIDLDTKRAINIQRIKEIVE